jgi:hypothetical protein
MKHLLLCIVLIAFAGCSTRSKIWNAGDLAQWVKDQAVEQGFQRDSVQLDEWYREDGGQNVWHGRGINSKTGKKSEFEVPVDRVWTPSSSQ